LNGVGSNLEYKSEVIINLKVTKIVHTILVYMYRSRLD